MAAEAVPLSIEEEQFFEKGEKEEERDRGLVCFCKIVAFSVARFHVPPEHAGEAKGKVEFKTCPYLCKDTAEGLQAFPLAGGKFVNCFT